MRLINATRSAYPERRMSNFEGALFYRDAFTQTTEIVAPEVLTRNRGTQVQPEILDRGVQTIGLMIRDLTLKKPTSISTQTAPVCRDEKSQTVGMTSMTDAVTINARQLFSRPDVRAEAIAHRRRSDLVEFILYMMCSCS